MTVHKSFIVRHITAENINGRPKQTKSEDLDSKWKAYNTSCRGSGFQAENSFFCVFFGIKQILLCWGDKI